MKGTKNLGHLPLLVSHNLKQLYFQNGYCFLFVNFRSLKINRKKKTLTKNSFTFISKDFKIRLANDTSPKSSESISVEFILNFKPKQNFE